MKCKNCNTKNEKDALFCKKCGESLVEEKIAEKIEKKVKKENKPKEKTKTKTKTKTKEKTKVVKEKVKVKEPKKEVKVEQEKESSTGKNFLKFFLTVIIIGLILILGCFGYDYYQKNYSISVPNFIGMTYEEAKDLAFERNLKIEKKETPVEDKNIDKVIKQNKKAKTKVKKNTVIKVNVGIKDTSYKVEKFSGMEVDKATKKLDDLGIKYDIQYNEDLCEDGKVLNQKPLPGEKMDKKYDKVTLLVCKEITNDSDDDYNEDYNEEDNDESEQEDEEELE